MSNPDQSPAVDERAAFIRWLCESFPAAWTERSAAHAWDNNESAVSAWHSAREPLLDAIAELKSCLAPTEAAAMAATVPAAELDPAPASSLPDWDECQMRVANSDFIAQRVAEGGYGADHDTKLATELHRFIYEYDDADPHRSAWFLHRLEKLLAETKAQAPVADQPAEPSHIHRKSGGRYTLLGEGRLQCDTPLADMAEIAIYRGEDGRLWARDAVEFAGRFDSAAPKGDSNG